MKRFLKILSTILMVCALAVGFTACGTNGDSVVDNTPEEEVTGESKILVAYFTWTGNSQQLANVIGDETGGEIFRIVPEEAYSTTYNDCADRAKNELDNGIRPALSSHIDKDVMATYDTVFIVYPVWWYDLPMSVWTFFEEYDFSGKTIIPVFSHRGSSSGANSLSTIAKLCPNSTFRRSDYLSLHDDKVETSYDAVREWVKKLGYSKQA